MPIEEYHAMTIPRGMSRKEVTVIIPYYENPLFIKVQCSNFMSYPAEDQMRLKVIFVDDGSPEYPLESSINPRDENSHIRWRAFRIEVDVRWNWLAARNIGAHNADDGWLLLTDMDHLIPATTFNALTRGCHEEGTIYRFSRREHTGEKIHPHPNSWFMTKKMFWRIGGYDEDASGHYGTDGDYRRRCAATAPVVIMSDELIRYEYFDDSSTRRYLRKQAMDAQGKAILRGKRANRLPPKVLSFPYHEL